MRLPGWTASRGSPAPSIAAAAASTSLGEQREPPEPRRAVGSAALGEHLLRDLDDLEDLAPEPEERLARSARGRRLLADPAQVETGLPAAPRPCDRGAGEKATTWSIATTPFGCAGAGARSGASERTVARPSSSSVAMSRSDQPRTPSPVPRAAEPHIDAGQPADVAVQLEPERRPALRLVRDLDLVDARHPRPPRGLALEQIG